MKKICDIKILIVELAGTGRGNHMDAARLLGITPSTLSNWIANGEFPASKAFMIDRFCRAHGIEICPELLGIKNHNDNGSHHGEAA